MKCIIFYSIADSHTLWRRLEIYEIEVEGRRESGSDFFKNLFSLLSRNMSLNDLCLTSAIAFTETNGFYLAVEKEIFPENRKLVLQNKNTKKFTEDFSGCQPNGEKYS